MAGSDFRSDKMPTNEGRGNASRGVEKYLDAHPEIFESVPLVRGFAVKSSVTALGFWLVWHGAGGFEGLKRLGMPERTIFHQVKLFRESFGVHPDEFVMPGVDLAEVQEHWLEWGGPRAFYPPEELARIMKEKRGSA